MNEKYLIFYDESGHTREFTYKLFKDKNMYYDHFSTCFVKLNKEKYDELIQKYTEIEAKYSSTELKSSIISANECLNGITGVNKYAVTVYNDIIDFLLKEDIEIKIYSFHKIEQLIIRLFSNNSILRKRENIFSITKLLFLYFDKEIAKLLMSNDTIDQFIIKFKEHLMHIKSSHLNNDDFLQENNKIEEIIAALNTYNKKITYNFSYQQSFLYYAYENRNLINYSIYIDQEGRGRTANDAAVYFEKNKIFEVNSKQEPAVRIADMCAGLWSRLLYGVSKKTRYSSVENSIDDSEPFDKWLDIDENSFKFYKKIDKLLLKNKINVWNGTYCEPHISLIVFLGYISLFDSYEEFNSYSKEDLMLYLNSNIEHTLKSFWTQ